jgi:hypothetical protein
MLEFAIANLVSDEARFEVPSAVGAWEFIKRHDYDKARPSLETGVCANLFDACLTAIGPKSSDADFEVACDEIVDISLVLSFLTARCVTPTGTTANSDLEFPALSDKFMRGRGIVGFPSLRPASLTAFFANWLHVGLPNMRRRTLRLQLCHWLSGLTCFSLEDIFLAVGVQMDIVKQRERNATGRDLTYFDGMTYASGRYSIPPLGSDYKKMRNDIVHEGVLSGSNFPGRSKTDCARVVTDTLNWLDAYCLAVLGSSGSVVGTPRWSGSDLDSNIAALTVACKAECGSELSLTGPRF